NNVLGCALYVPPAPPSAFLCPPDQKRTHRLQLLTPSANTSCPSKWFDVAGPTKQGDENVSGNRRIHARRPHDRHAHGVRAARTHGPDLQRQWISSVVPGQDRPGVRILLAADAAGTRLGLVPDPAECSWHGSSVP